MNKFGIAIAAAIAMFSLQAHAQEQTKPDCKHVTFSRQDAKTTSITMTFRGELAKAIAGCDQKETDFVKADESPTGGVRVTFKVTNGQGKIALPILFTSGSADQVVCQSRTDGTKHAKFAVQWEGVLPDSLTANKLSSYDTSAADEGCGKLVAALAAQQKK